MNESNLTIMDNLYNEQKYRQFEDLDKNINRASSKLDMLDAELTCNKNFLETISTSISNHWPFSYSSSKSAQSTFEMKNATSAKSNGDDKTQGKNNSLSRIATPRIDMTELFKEDKFDEVQTNDDKEDKYKGIQHSISVGIDFSPLKSNRKCCESLTKVVNHTSVPSKSSMQSDNFKKDIQMASPSLDKLNSLLNEELTLKQSKQSLQKCKSKKKLTKNNKNRKLILTRKKSTIIKTAEFITKPYKMQKDLKLKKTSSRSTCVTVRNDSFDEQSSLISTKIRSDKYVYPELNYEMKREVAGKTATVSAKNKYVEVDEINDVNSDSFVIVEKKTGEMKSQDENQNQKKPVGKTENSFGNADESLKLDKTRVVKEKNVVEKEVAKINEEKKSFEKVRTTLKEEKKEKIKEIIELKCPRIDEEAEFDKISEMEEKKEEINYNEFLTAKRYENPTVASNAKHADINYYRKYHFKYIPFIAGTSITPSHNIGLNVQQILGLMKNKQLSFNSSTRMLIRKVSRGMKPISSLQKVDQANIDESSYKMQNNKSIFNGSQNAVWINEFSDNNTEVTSKFSTLNKSMKSIISTQNGDKSADSIEEFSAEIQKKLLQSNNTDGDSVNFNNHRKNITQISNVFKKLYNQFENLQIKYEKLLAKSEKSNNPTIQQELANLEQELAAKEEEVNVFIYLYQEILNLKQQIKQINERKGLVCITTEESYSKLPNKYSNLNNLRYRSQSFLGTSNIRLLTMLKNFQLSHK